MKGIVMAAGLMALCMGVSVGLIYYISHEQLRLNTQTSLKQALNETMAALDELDPNLREAQALTIFASNFSIRKTEKVHYQLDLMGFMADPLALRIRIKALETSALFKIELSLEETMIEVDREKQ